MPRFTALIIPPVAEADSQGAGRFSVPGHAGVAAATSTSSIHTEMIEMSGQELPSES